MIQESNLSKFKAEVQSSQVFIDFEYVLCGFLRFMILVHKDELELGLVVNMLGLNKRLVCAAYIHSLQAAGILLYWCHKYGFQTTHELH